MTIKFASDFKLILKSDLQNFINIKKTGNCNKEIFKSKKCGSL